jgi:hypothetical protein
MIALSLFDYTGESLKPWLEAGFECHLVDIQHEDDNVVRDDGMITHDWDLSTCPSNEILKLMERDDIAFCSMYPPCDNLAVSGARWFAGKGLRVLQSSIGMFATCTEVAEMIGCPYYIENPVSTISTYWRPSDTSFSPCDYSGYADDMTADDYVKTTHLWYGGGFIMPPRRRLDDLFDLMDMPNTTWIHHQPPGPERSNIRSKTAQGWARAVYEANKSEV